MQLLRPQADDFPQWAGPFKNSVEVCNDQHGSDYDESEQTTTSFWVVKKYQNLSIPGLTCAGQCSCALLGCRQGLHIWFSLRSAESKCRFVWDQASNDSIWVDSVFQRGRRNVNMRYPGCLQALHSSVNAYFKPIHSAFQLSHAASLDKALVNSSIGQA